MFLSKRHGCGKPGQWCPIVHRDTIPGVPAAGLQALRALLIELRKLSYPALQCLQRIGGLCVEADFGRWRVFVHDIDQLLE